MKPNGGPVSLSDQLAEIRKHLTDARGSGLRRIAVAVHDAVTDDLKAYVSSTEGDDPFMHYSAKLAAVPSLTELAETAKTRTLTAIPMEGERLSLHQQRLIQKGYRSSHTVPFYRNGSLFGFVFYDSDQEDFFSPVLVHHLEIHTRLISMLVFKELSIVQNVQSVIDTVREVSRVRDSETAGHLGRMAQYTRLIAVEIAKDYNLTDEFIEFLYQVAPLHDIGKMGTADAILLKPGRLTEDEWEQMKFHVFDGAQIIESMIKNFDLMTSINVDVLRNVVLFHHEAMDGSGYPYGLSGKDIPLEARICAVADCFDALTSIRPYKARWSIEKALNFISVEACEKFDQDCVRALVANRGAIDQIVETYQEDSIG